MERKVSVTLIFPSIVLAVFSKLGLIWSGHGCITEDVPSTMVVCYDFAAGYVVVRSGGRERIH